MKQPSMSPDGNCPSCQSHDWKLAKMIVLEGTVKVETESSGGGFGVSGGLGRGKGGIDISYQDMDLETEGTHSTTLALKYAAPAAPGGYQNRRAPFDACAIALHAAASDIVVIDEFAKSTQAIKPSFFALSGTDSMFKSWEKQFHEAAAKIGQFRQYEIEMATWERTRVCTRCGEPFITAADKQLAASSLEVPRYVFEGQERRCPKCKSYQWKMVDVFFAIRVREAEQSLESAKQALQKDLEYAENPDEGGFWRKLSRRLSTLQPEVAERAVKSAQGSLNAIMAERIAAVRRFPDLGVGRVCIACGALYTLADCERPDTPQ